MDLNNTLTISFYNSSKFYDKTSKVMLYFIDDDTVADQIELIPVENSPVFSNSFRTQVSYDNLEIKLYEKKTDYDNESKVQTTLELLLQSDCDVEKNPNIRNISLYYINNELIANFFSEIKIENEIDIKLNINEIIANMKIQSDEFRNFSIDFKDIVKSFEKKLPSKCKKVSNSQSDKLTSIEGNYLNICKFFI